MFKTAADVVVRRRECEGLVLCRGVILVAVLSVVLLKASIRFVDQKGDVHGRGGGVVGFVLSDGLDALPHASGV